MFTGIVESTGRVHQTSRHRDRLVIDMSGVVAEIAPGDSVAVNGVCLTAVTVEGDLVSFDVVPETLQRSNLGGLDPFQLVNLECPLLADGRFNGHIVQGHVDGVGKVTAIFEEGQGRRMAVEYPATLGRYLVEKGSVAVDGVSLTIAAVTPTTFEVALVPHTLEVTTLGLRRAGDQVNLECDVLAKYVERLLEARS
jgi:riboflavin synthase